MFEFFRTLSLLSDVPDSAIQTLCKLSRQQFYNRNDILIEQEANVGTVFFVQSGFIKLVRMDEEGRECIQRIVGEGFLLPGTSLFYHDPLPTFAHCLTDATVIAVAQRDFEEWVAPFSKTLMRLAGEMNRRVYHMYQWTHQLAVSDTTQRVHYFLQYWASTYGYPETDGVHIDFPITQTEMAQLLGIRRESVNRVWNDLRKRRVLRGHNQSWILDADWHVQIS